MQKRPKVKAFETANGTVYRLDYYSGGKRLRPDFPFKYQAEAMAERIWQDHLKAKQRPEGSASGLGEWLEGYFMILENSGKKPITVSRYRREIEKFLSWLSENFGNVQTLDDVSTEMGHKYLEHLRNDRSYKIGKPLSEGTRWLILKILKGFFKAAREQSPPKMYTDPFKAIRMKKPRGQTGTRVLTNPEVSKIRGAEGLIRDICVFSLYTGLRLQEVTELRRTSINAQQNTIDLLGKGDKRRLIPIHKEVAKLIKKYRGESETLFINPDTKTVFNKTSLGKKVKKFLYFLEIDDKASHHSFRKSFATEVDYKSKDRLATEILLGHRNEDYITSRYLAANLERLRRAIDTITFE
jgi:site-specific recombinase XerD